MKADVDVDKGKKKEKKEKEGSWNGEGRAFIPFLKLHLYFTEVTEDRLLYFHLRNETCLSWLTSCVLGYFDAVGLTCMLMITLYFFSFVKEDSACFTPPPPKKKNKSHFDGFLFYFILFCSFVLFVVSFPDFVPTKGNLCSAASFTGIIKRKKENRLWRK